MQNGKIIIQKAQTVTQYAEPLRYFTVTGDEYFSTF